MSINGTRTYQRSPPPIFKLADSANSHPITDRLNPFSIFYVGSTRDYRLYEGANDPRESWQLAHRQYFVKFQHLFKI